MTKKLYIDLAIHMGFAEIQDDSYIRHGHIELDKDRTIEEYTSSQCRKKLPKIADNEEWIRSEGEYTIGVNLPHDDISGSQRCGDGGKNIGTPYGHYGNPYIYDNGSFVGLDDEKYCLIKTKKVIEELSHRDQLIKLGKFLRPHSDEMYHVGDEVIIEEPHTTGNFSTRKTLALFGIADLHVEDGYREIKESVWFKGITNELPELKIGNDGVNTKKVNRKKTSKAIASFLMQKEIKDDNEADAICMMFYDNQKLFYKYKAEAEIEAEKTRLNMPRLGIPNE